MKCNKGTDLVCTYWEKCNKANICDNVPIGIKNKLEEKRLATYNWLENQKKVIIVKPKRVKKVAR